MDKEIKKIAMMASLKFKKNPQKLNSELKMLMNYVKKSDVFVGKKKKIYKTINSFKI
jgi:Asp-tRNA(Asn)/Glu-tRNA(Gln) amidotransferase C subunit